MLFLKTTFPLIPIRIGDVQLMSNVYAADALKGRIVVVTGGGRGIGSGISKVVAAAGDRKSTRLNSSHMSESRMPSSA